mgnify:CR=1 FL=1
MAASFMILMVLFGILTGGCRSKQHAATDGLVTIGVILPSSDKTSAAQDFQDGVELALSIVNDRVDLPFPLAAGAGLSRHGGLPLRAMYRRPEANTRAAVAALEDLMVVGGLKAILSALNDDATLAVSEKAEVMGIPLLSCTATAARLSQRRLQWFFQLNPDDTLMVDDFLTHWQEILAPASTAMPRRLTVVHDKGLRGVGVARAVRNSATQCGLNILAEIVYDLAEPSLAPLALVNRKFLHGEMVVLQTDTAERANLWFQVWQSLGIRPKAVLVLPFSGPPDDFIKIASVQEEPVFVQLLENVAVPNTNFLQTWVAYLYRQRFGREFSSTAAISLTGTLVLADALNRAAKLNRRDIREALLQTDIPSEQLLLPWPGVKFDPGTGQNVLATAYIGQFRDRGVHLVWPRTLTAGPVNWPCQSGKPESRP